MQCSKIVTGHIFQCWIKWILNNPGSGFFQKHLRLRIRFYAAAFFLSEKKIAPKLCFISTEVLCEDPLSVKDGFIEVTNFKGQYVYGSVATYHCNPGYILWGNASRLCAQDGAWTGTQPQCKTISCGQPPEVPNSHYRLANGTSTSWLSLALYFCQPGHRMIHHQHGKN